MGPDDFELIRPQIDRIVTSICRRNHLAPADCDDFRQHVYLKLIESDYGVLGKFKGRSNLSTYLTTVITRLYSQHRYHLWGKWRPSAAAKRLGDKAITVERMLTRDSLTLHEVIETLTTGKAPAFTREEIETIYALLPPRSPRPVLVTDQVLPEPEGNHHSDDDVMDDERGRIAREIVQILKEQFRSFDAEDRIILQLRFWHGRTVPEIAAALKADQKKLYKRIDRLTADLGKELERRGVSAEDALDVVAHGHSDLVLDGENRPENAPPGPSHETDGDLGEGTGRRGDDDDDD